MNDQRPGDDAGPERPRAPGDLGRLFLERANAGDVDGVVALYEPDAVLVGPSGERVRGAGAIRAVYEKFLASGPTFAGDVRPPLRVGDLALTSTQFDVITADGGGRTFAARTATAEVARQQPDGTWLWVMDQPNVLGP
jgi:uncharacterized protein (TIGR02246 family)